MKLIDLAPEWLNIINPNERRLRVGVDFNCPCGCGHRIPIYFTKPFDDGPPVTSHAWANTGCGFEDLTLAPSILVTKPPGCGWHGYVRNGEIVSA